MSCLKAFISKCAGYAGVQRKHSGRCRPEECSRLTKQLAIETGYSFTTDYVSPHTSRWSTILEAYKDQAGTRMLEIGSYEGRSAVWFVTHILTHDSSRLVCVDYFHNALKSLRFDHNIRRTGSPEKVTKIRGSSVNALKGLSKDTFDIIYVDGSHRAADVLMDAIMSWPLLNANGVLIFDDYDWEPAKEAADTPKLGINLFLDIFAGEYDLLHRDYQVILRKLSAAGRKRAASEANAIHSGRSNGN